ncbi:putative multicopper oxidase, type 1, partial [Aureobasidium melanogenum]
MHFQKLTGLCLLAFASVSWADALPEGHYLWGADRMGKMVRRATSSSSSSIKASSTSKTASSSTSLVADAACTNGPNSRQCWSNGYSVKTDFDQKHPTTGNTVTYNLEITNTTCNPDGNGAIECFLINGQQPGPVITANWGDQVVINVKNSLQNNGSSFHWHGVRQLNSVGSDGVGGLTECPIPPGGSRTYSFLATQFGTSWYHSHYSSQYGMGVTGTIVINGPATSNYDIDLGAFPVSDWYYGLATRVNDVTLYNLQNNAPPPNGDNILVNGKGMSASGAGAYAQMTLTPNKRHRLRLINTSVDNAIRVKLDGHNFTVISADFIPVKPLTGQDWILLAVGQRYDVIFTANQTPGNYFFRAEAATDCYSGNNKGGRALFTYSGVTAANPTDSNEAPPTNGCSELVTVPYWTQAVDQSQYAAQVQTLSTGVAPGVTTNGQNFALWHLDTTAMMINWDKPTLQYIFEGNTSYPDPYAVIEVPTEGQWTYWLIQMGQQNPPLPHPIHLHGHDFFVLGSGAGVFDSSTASLNFANPPRRDTSILPGLGWLLIAFPANNPGVWLMHCHIAWHISEGLGVQFIESKSTIQMPDQTTFNSQCEAWRSYSANMAYPQIDSGL